MGFALFKYFPFGGLQRDFLRIAGECRRRGFDVRVYTLSWEGPVPEGFDVVTVPVTAVTNHERYRRFADWLSNDLRLRPVECLVGFNKMPGLDIYYAADSCYEEKAQQLRAPMYRLTARYRLFSSFEHAVFDPEEAVTTLLITEQQKRQFQKYYETLDSQLHILPPGISPDRRRGDDADAVRAEFRREFDLEDHDRLLLLVGSGFITKGVDRALRALASLPPALLKSVRFFVIGQDNPRQFQRLAEELGVDDRFRIFPGRDDVPRFLQGADVMLHPAYMENSGTVLLEALVAGLPVIATDVCGYAHYVVDSGGGVIVESPFSQEALNGALERLLVDDAFRAECSKRGIEFGRTADVYQMAERAVDLIEAELSA
ncbi:MAG: glycosyltransferase family 4 protein [Pseudomonadota bacterium]